MRWLIVKWKWCITLGLFVLFLFGGNSLVLGADVHYKDWYFNEDMTKVTINGRVYDNLLQLAYWPQDKTLWLRNIAMDYLTNGTLQAEYTPEEWFQAYPYSGRQEYPNPVELLDESKEYAWEVLEDNYVPWYETDEGKKYIEKRMSEYSMDGAWGLTQEELAWCKTAIQGYRSGKGLTSLEDAQGYPVYAHARDVVKNYEEYIKLREPFKEEILKGVNSLNYQEKIIDIIEAQGETVILNDSPKQNGETILGLELVLYIDKPEYIVNGTPKMLDAAPLIVNGVTLVPVRGVMEALGSSVAWNGENRQVAVTGSGMKILLTLDQSNAEVNEETVPLLQPPQIINGRTMIPLRFISETLRYRVDWDAGERKITIHG
jgi:hypothetical protein